MRTVGSLLHEERLKQGLTLEMVRVDTRISLRNLEAIEADHLVYFSSPFFYKSFVKQFAASLQMDFAVLASLLESQASGIPIPPIPGEDTRPLPNVPALRQLGKKSFARWAIPAASLVVVLIGCSVVYAWWENARGAVAALTASSPTKVSPAAPAAKKQDTANTPSGDPSSAPKEDSSAPQREVAAQPNATATGAIHLELAAVERTWVSVVSDGKSIFSGILDPDQTKVFDGNETARIKAGNAGGVHIVFNGRVIGALGPRGQVRTAVFTPDNFEIVDPASHFEFRKVSRITE
jgi:cytoskeletal protein RodZ